MKLKRILVAAGSALALMVGTVLVCEMYWSSPSGHVNGVKVSSAAREYVRQLKSAGVTPPPKVDLKELIARGLLKPADVSAFEGMDVTVSLSEDARADQALMSARMPDGTMVVLLGDGSVQQRTR